ncbi:MAG: dihydrofolate reductase [Steroidobacteraceae bacterium]
MADTDRPAAAAGPVAAVAAPAVTPRIALVAAIADNGIIGRGGALPWHLPDDLRHFKAITLGKPVLMGRHTYEAIGKPLPGRRNLVMSRQAATISSSQPAAEVEYVPDLAAALALVGAAPELCVIGGAQIYAVTLPLATRIYLTHVHAAVDGDVRFPLSYWGEWREAERSEHPADARHAYAMSFVRLERARSPRAPFSR